MIGRTACPLLLLVAACESQEPAANLAPEQLADGPVAAEQSADAPVAAAGDGRIPEAMQGRWGLVPADCEPGRPDAKGLLVIDGESLEFYESVAELGDVAARDARDVRARFAFTGEGMEWTREMELALEDGGDTLMRREFGEDAMDGPLVYSRCE